MITDDMVYKEAVRLGGLFYQERKRLAITQTEASRLSGVHREIIGELENGKSTNPKLNTLIRLCKFYGLRIVLEEDPHGQTNP